MNQFCQIEYAASDSDVGMPCGRNAIAKCGDCGMSICSDCSNDLMALRALAEVMTRAIHFLLWPEPSHVGQFWLFHAGISHTRRFGNNSVDSDFKCCESLSISRPRLASSIAAISLISAINFCESCSLPACSQSSIHFSVLSRMAHYLLGMCPLESTRRVARTVPSVF